MLWSWSSSGHGWYYTVLKLGVLISSIYIHNGACRKSKPNSEDSSAAAIQDPYDRHSHSPWISSDKSIVPWDYPHMPNIVPLTLSEQNLRQSRKTYPSNSNTVLRSNNANETIKKSQKSQSTKSKKNDSREKGKSGSDNHNQADQSYPNSSPDLTDIREKAFSFAALVVEFLSGELNEVVGESRGARSILSNIANSFKVAQNREGEAGEGGGDRGVIDWLARLIGVQGKTLGEFLREYQVHVLYDLVFTFFKWIFFLYAGLLIP